MMEVENFTIFIKNSIRFPLFNFTKSVPTKTIQRLSVSINIILHISLSWHKDAFYLSFMISVCLCLSPFFLYCSFLRGNILLNITDKYIKSCNFEPVRERYCPIFKVGDVIGFAQQNLSILADKVSATSILTLYTLVLSLPLHYMFTTPNVFDLCVYICPVFFLSLCFSLCLLLCFREG